MKSKEEILIEHFGTHYYHHHHYLREDIFNAMKEYAAQFKLTPQIQEGKCNIMVRCLMSVLRLYN